MTRAALGAIRRFLVDRGGAVALAGLVTYVWIAEPHIVDGDNAEFATHGTMGGVAHPTGYPAYLLWLRATAWLPGATPAHTTAIATAILAGLQLLVLHAACRAWGARAGAASLAVAIYAAGPVAMRYSSEAEIFVFNQLVVATVLYLAAREGPLRGTWRVAGLGLAAGVGLAGHVTCVLVAPVGLLGAVRGVREAGHPVRAAAAGVAALVLGLAPYAYLFVTEENMISWMAPRDAHDLVDHFLRRAYGGPGAFSSAGGKLHPVENLLAFAITLGRAWWWLPAVSGLVALGHRCLRTSGDAGLGSRLDPGDGSPDRRCRGEPRSGWRWLALSLVIAGPLLAARFDVVPRGHELYVVRRFHLMATLLIALPVAAALDVVLARYQARLRAGAITAIAVLGFATAALLTLPDVMRVRTPALENAMRGMLRGLPPDAVVLLTGDLNIFGTGYLQVARGERPDVVVGLWRFVRARWYRERLAARGIVIEQAADGKPSVLAAERILASGRPLFVDLSLGNVIMEFPNYPHGTLFRVLPRGQPRPSIDEIAALNRTWFAALDLDYPRPGPADEYPTIVHRGYAETWRIIAGGYTAAGRHGDAAAAAEVMRELAPLP